MLSFTGQADRQLVLNHHQASRRHGGRTARRATTYPEDIDLGAIKADLEFLIEQTEWFREGQALKPLYAMVGSAAIVIAWIELFWLHCP